MKFVAGWLINAVALLIVARLVPGILVSDWTAAIAAAFILAVLNMLLKPILIIITLPINILSLGVFTLVINSFLLAIAARFVNGFSISGFWSAFWGALLLSIVSIALNVFINPSQKMNVRFHRRPGSEPRRQRTVIDAEIVPDASDTARQKPSVRLERKP